MAELLSNGGDAQLAFEKLDADDVVHYCSLARLEAPTAQSIRPSVQDAAEKQAAAYASLLQGCNKESQIALEALRQEGPLFPLGISEDTLETRCQQLQGCRTLTGTYSTGVQRLAQLHRFSMALIAAVHSPHPVRCSVKRPIRLRRKTLEDGPQEFWAGDFGRVADVFRASVTVDTLADVHRLLSLLKGFGRDGGGEGASQLGLSGRTTFVLERLKNRFAEPCLHGGYVDLIAHVRVDGYMAEVQVHWRPAQLAREDAGCRIYSWARRFLRWTENRFEGESSSKSEIRTGPGKQYYALGAVYQGQWKDDLRHGSGALLLSSGETCEGAWVSGKMHGPGRYLYVNGESYEGQWLGGNMHGVGTYEYVSGNTYTGSWAEDMKHGKGAFRYAGSRPRGAEGCEERYEGEFCDDRFHGWGIYTFATGDVYEGGYEAGQMHGHGCLKRTSGECYDGEWVRGTRHGAGTTVYAAGDSYEGEWAQDMRHGCGVFARRDGRLDLIVSAKGLPNGPGLRRAAAGDLPVFCRLLDGQPVLERDGCPLSSRKAAELAAELGFPGGFDDPTTRKLPTPLKERPLRGV